MIPTRKNGFAWQGQYICNVCMNQRCTRSAKTLKTCRKTWVTINSWYGKTDMKTRPYRSMGPKTNTSHKMTGWWFPSTHLTNMLVKLGSSSSNSGLEKKLFELPPATLTMKPGRPRESNQLPFPAMTLTAWQPSSVCVLGEQPKKWQPPPEIHEDGGV